MNWNPIVININHIKIITKIFPIKKLQIFKTAYSNIPDEPDREPYSAKNMLNYGHDFIEKIDYRYVEDIQQNL